MAKIAYDVTNTACACTQVMSPSSTSKLHSEYTPIIFPNETEFFQPEHDFSTDAASDGSNLEVQRLAVSSRHAVASTERKNLHKLLERQAELAARGENAA